VPNVCFDCAMYDEHGDFHPWFLGGCTRFDNRWVWHSATHEACSDFEPKDETKNETPE